MAVNRDNEVRSGPGGCTAALIARGEHHWCDQRAGHTGWPHGSKAAETIWRGVGPAEDPADVQDDETSTDGGVGAIVDSPGHD